MKMTIALRTITHLSLSSRKCYKDVNTNTFLVLIALTIILAKCASKKQNTRLCTSLFVMNDLKKQKPILHAMSCAIKMNNGSFCLFKCCERNDSRLTDDSPCRIV